MTVVTVFRRAARARELGLGEVTIGLARESGARLRHVGAPDA